MVYIATRWSSALRALTRGYLNGTLSGALFLPTSDLSDLSDLSDKAPHQ